MHITIFVSRWYNEDDYNDKDYYINDCSTEDGDEEVDIDDDELIILHAFLRGSVLSARRGGFFYIAGGDTRCSMGSSFFWACVLADRNRPEAPSSHEAKHKLSHASNVAAQEDDFSVRRAVCHHGYNLLPFKPLIRAANRNKGLIKLNDQSLIIAHSINHSCPLVSSGLCEPWGSERSSFWSNRKWSLHLWDEVRTLSSSSSEAELHWQHWAGFSFTLFPAPSVSNLLQSFLCSRSF